MTPDPTTPVPRRMTHSEMVSAHLAVEHISEITPAVAGRFFTLLLSHIAALDAECAAVAGEVAEVVKHIEHALRMEALETDTCCLEQSTIVITRFISPILIERDRLKLQASTWLDEKAAILQIVEAAQRKDPHLIGIIERTCNWLNVRASESVLRNSPGGEGEKQS